MFESMLQVAMFLVAFTSIAIVIASVLFVVVMAIEHLYKKWSQK